MAICFVLLHVMVANHLSLSLPHTNKYRVLPPLPQPFGSPSLSLRLPPRSVDCRHDSMDFLPAPPLPPTSLCCMFSDDDFFDCSWCTPSPRRCDRGLSLAIDSAAAAAAHSNLPGDDKAFCFREKLAECCTEELGSESTSGAGCAAAAAEPAIHCNPSIFYEDHASCMPEEAARIWSSLPADTSGRRVEEDVADSPQQNWIHEGNALRRHTQYFSNLRRAFPPPLSSLLCDRPLMRPSKSNGRFVLRRIDNASRSFFRATRKNGSLRLDLLSSHGSLHDHSTPLFPASPSMRTRPDVTIKRHSFLDYIPLVPSFKWDLRSRLAGHEALARLMGSEGSLVPLAEEPKAPLPGCPQAVAKCWMDAGKAAVQRSGHVFALLNLFPIGLGLIILEVGQCKRAGSFVALHGVYILKGLGLQCSGNQVTLPPYPTSPQLTALRGGECQAE